MQGMSGNFNFFVRIKRTHIIIITIIIVTIIIITIIFFYKRYKALVPLPSWVMSCCVRCPPNGMAVTIATSSFGFDKFHKLKKTFPQPVRRKRCEAKTSIPGHALHEKGLQSQKGDGPLVSSQEQKALLVLLINRLSTGCQPVFVFPHGFNKISLVYSFSRKCLA